MAMFQDWLEFLFANNSSGRACCEYGPGFGLHSSIRCLAGCGCMVVAMVSTSATCKIQMLLSLRPARTSVPGQHAKKSVFLRVCGKDSLS